MRVTPRCSIGDVSMPSRRLASGDSVTVVSVASVTPAVTFAGGTLVSAAAGSPRPQAGDNRDTDSSTAADVRRSPRTRDLLGRGAARTPNRALDASAGALLVGEQFPLADARVDQPPGVLQHEQVRHLTLPPGTLGIGHCRLKRADDIPAPRRQRLTAPGRAKTRPRGCRGRFAAAPPRKSRLRAAIALRPGREGPGCD